VVRSSPSTRQSIQPSAHPSIQPRTLCRRSIRPRTLCRRSVGACSAPVVYGAVAPKSCARPVARARLSADRPAEPLRLSSGAWANCWFSALAPGRTAVSAPRAPSARGLGQSADRPAEPLRLSVDAWANCWFSALAPGRTAVSAPRAPSARGLGLSSTDRLAERLVLSPGARGEPLFPPTGRRRPGGSWPVHGGHAEPLRRLGERLVSCPAAGANCPGRISVTRRKAGFPGTSRTTWPSC
jgi:hypothetical protein